MATRLLVLPDGIWLASFLPIKEDCNFVRWKELVKKKNDSYVFREIKQGEIQYNHVIIIELMMQ